MKTFETSYRLKNIAFSERIDSAGGHKIHLILISQKVMAERLLDQA